MKKTSKSDQKQLEKQFKQALKKAQPEIDKRMEIARKAIQEAIEISEEYGVPFEGISNILSDSFVPRSFVKKWSKLDKEFLDQFEDIDKEGCGWQHSDLCW